MPGQNPSFGTLLLVALMLVGLGIGCGSRSASPPGSAAPAQPSSSQPTPSTSAPDRPAPDPAPHADPELGAFGVQVLLVDFAGNYTLMGNGFPVEREPVYIRARTQRIAARLTPALIGQGNVATVQVTPYLQAYGERLKVGPVRMKIWVERVNGSAQADHVPLPGTEVGAATVDSVVAAWRTRAEAAFDSLRAAGQGLSALRAWATRYPIRVETPPFDNDVGPDFSAVFEEAPVIAGTAADSARLRAYAVRLRDWMAEKDTLALYEAYRPNFDAADVDSAKAVDIIANDWFLVDWNTDFEQEAVGLRSWSGGRVWELYRRDDRRASALFLAGDTRLVSTYEAFVAEMDGDLRVVR